MHISWLGSTAIKIQARPLDRDVTVVIDPYKPKKGNFPRSLTPDVGLYTHGADNSITLSGNPFILDTAGECETNGVLITSVPGHESDQFLLRVDVEQMSLAHLGRCKKPLTDEQLELLGNIDILCVPVGGKDCYNAEEAVKAVNSIEPRVVIPILHKSENDPEAKEVKLFVKEMGVQNGEAEKKVIIKKNNLPQEETRVVVLQKE